MPDQWSAIYRDSDGELISVGTVVASNIPPGLTVVPLPEEPDFKAKRWNKVLKALEDFTLPPVVVPLAIERIEAQPEVTGLAAGIRNTLHNVLLRLALDRLTIGERIEAQAEIAGLTVGQRNALHNVLVRLGYL